MYLGMCVCTHTLTGIWKTEGDVRELDLLYGMQGSKSGHQAWQQVPELNFCKVLLGYCKVTSPALDHFLPGKYAYLKTYCQIQDTHPSSQAKGPPILTQSNRQVHKLRDCCSQLLEVSGLVIGIQSKKKYR